MSVLPSKVGYENTSERSRESMFQSFFNKRDKQKMQRGRTKEESPTYLFWYEAKEVSVHRNKKTRRCIPLKRERERERVFVK